MKRQHPTTKGVILAPAHGEGLPWTSIQLLEALRDQTIAEDWVQPAVKRSVLFGIKLCIAALRRDNINEIA
jgi:hypothetical protein